ncbi:MAG: NAD(P)-dependent oxidoreductase [Bacteroidales bacterium]|nr:NAD(P)-dependent oxidoreductase [Bacteroidales bacterium]
MNILVFGGNGYIGKNVIQYLIKDKHKVTVVDIDLTDQFVMNNCNCIKGNILDKHFVKEVITNYDLVYNFAAVSNVELNSNYIENAIKVNLIGLVSILESCVYNKVDRIIHASSVYALYEKGGIYSITKRGAEELIYHYNRQYGLNYTILRYGTLYGPKPGQGNSLYHYLKMAIFNKEIEYIGDGNELREYIHIEDAAKLTIKIMDKKYQNEVVLITGLHSYRIKDIFELMREMIGDDIQIKYKQSDNNYHYKITPYNYKEKLSKKILLDEYIDIHQGLYNIMLKMNK